MFPETTTTSSATLPYVQDPLHASATLTYSQPRKTRSKKRKSGDPSRTSPRTLPSDLIWDRAPPAAPATYEEPISMSSLSPTEKKVVEAFHEAGRRRRVKEEFSHFCSETSFTAMVRIYNARSWARRIGWILVVLGMFSWLFVQCFWLLDKYFSYPMEVKLEMLAAKQLEFPSVTVCNLNPIKVTELEKAPAFHHLADVADGIRNSDVLFDYFYQNYREIYSTPPPPTGTPPTWNPNSPSADSTPPPPTGTPPTWNPNSPSAASGLPRSSRVPSPSTPARASGLPRSSRVPSPSTPAGASSRPPPPQMSDSPPTGPTLPPADTPITSPPVPGSRRKRHADDRGTASDKTRQPSRGISHNSEPFSSMSGNMSNVRPRDLASHLDVEHDMRHTLLSGNDVPDDVVKEADWRRLESEIFGDEGMVLERFRRSEDSSGERLGILKNNSFNKWNALDSSGINISYYRTRGVEYRAAMAYATIAARVGSDRAKKTGHLLKDALISCRFNGYQCSPRNFSYFHNHKYGNCFTFNSVDVEEKMYTKFSGPEYGLTLEFYLQQNEYVPALAPEAGIRVVIQPKGTMAFPEDDGVSISPSHSTSISLRKTEMSRLGPPHGICDDSKADRDLYVTYMNMSYSKLSCLKSCYQTIVNKHCNCSLPVYYVTDSDKVCDMTLDDDSDCASKLPEKVPEEYSQCDVLCPQPCFQTDHSMTLSSAAWPSDEYKGFLETKVKQSNYLLIDTELEEEDFAKLNVFYQDLLYNKIQQQKAYESQNLISDIGGQLGLWLGLSAITIGELCGLMLSLFRSITTVSPDEENGGVSTTRSSTTQIKPFTTVLDYEDDGRMKVRGHV